MGQKIKVTQNHLRHIVVWFPNDFGQLPFWPFEQKLGEWAKNQCCSKSHKTHFWIISKWFWATLNNWMWSDTMLISILVFQDRVGGRTYGRQLKAAEGTDMWDLGGQWIGRWEDDFVEEKQSSFIRLIRKYFVKYSWGLHFLFLQVSASCHEYDKRVRIRSLQPVYWRPKSSATWRRYNQDISIDHTFLVTTCIARLTPIYE